MGCRAFLKLVAIQEIVLYLIIFFSVKSGPLNIIQLAESQLILNIHDKPNPNIIDNIKENQYKDKSDHCFTYNLKEVKCPLDDNLLHNIKIQN